MIKVKSMKPEQIGREDLIPWPSYLERCLTPRGNVNSWNSQLPFGFFCGKAELRELKASHCSAFVLRAGTTYLNVRQWELL